jgi:hypothetical protein
MKIKIVLLCCITTLLVSSCDNEIDINAPWIETPVIYGLLDAGFDVQYIRIQKTYQNDVNTPTSATAQINDSLFFDSLDVRVTTRIGEVFVFVKDTSIQKEPGFFSTQNHFVYKCVGFRPALGREYDLIVRNLKSGKVYRATTRIVGPARLANTNSQPVFSYIPGLGNNFVTDVIAGENIHINDAGIRLYYLESPNNNPSASTERFVDHKFFSSNTAIGSGSRVRLQAPVQNIMQTFEEFLPRNNNVTRRLTKMNIFWMAGTEEMGLIIELSQPTQFLVQRRPEFTNIDNGGLGIFTSRTSSFFPLNYSDTTARNISNRLGFQFP